MNLPGFSAELAVGKATRTYRNNYAQNAFSHNSSSLMPSQFADEAEAGDLDDGSDGMDDVSDNGDLGSLEDGELEGDDFE